MFQTRAYMYICSEAYSNLVIATLLPRRAVRNSRSERIQVYYNDMYVIIIFKYLI